MIHHSVPATSRVARVNARSITRCWDLAWWRGGVAWDGTGGQDAEELEYATTFFNKTVTMTDGGGGGLSASSSETLVKVCWFDGFLVVSLCSLCSFVAFICAVRSVRSRARARWAIRRRRRRCATAPVATTWLDVRSHSLAISLSCNAPDLPPSVRRPTTVLTRAHATLQAAVGLLAAVLLAAGARHLSGGGSSRKSGAKAMSKKARSVASKAAQQQQASATAATGKGGSARPPPPPSKSAPSLPPEPKQGGGGDEIKQRRKSKK